MIKFLLLFLLLIPKISNNNVTLLFNKIVEKNKQYSNISFDFIISQRIDNKIHKSKAFVKYQRSPRCLYYKQFYPQKGVEILYNKNKSASEVLVNPNDFPWVNLNLNYNSMELRKNQHHSVLEANFDYIISIAQKTFNNLDKNKKTSLSEINYKGVSCYKITYENLNYKFLKYTVKQGETVSSIAKKFYINDYKIFEINNLSSYGKVNSGKVLVIPNDYAKKTIFIIDKTTLLPKNIKIYDEKGLFEELEYFNIKTNLKFKADEFSKL